MIAIGRLYSWQNENRRGCFWPGTILKYCVTNSYYYSTTSAHFYHETLSKSIFFVFARQWNRQHQRHCLTYVKGEIKEIHEVTSHRFCLWRMRRLFYAIVMEIKQGHYIWLRQLVGSQNSLTAILRSEL